MTGLVFRREIRRLMSLAGVLLLLMGAGTARAQGSAPTRVALVIQNSDYANPRDRLAGPARDARFMQEALESKRLGFHVIQVRNATKAQMEEGLKRFQNALKDAGPAGIGLVYYAGHAAADRNGSDNYLLPVDTPDVATAAVATVGLGLRTITERLAYLDRRAAIVIVVDACRTPAGASADDKLVKPDEQQPGFLVALSTSKGLSANDNSPYAELLAKALQADGLTLDQVFQQVRQEVARATNERQFPTEQSRLVEKVCLISCGGGATAAGPYSQNPELLKSARSTAEGWITRLGTSSTIEKICGSGWRDLIALNASARKASDNGQPDTAGATYAQLAEKAAQIMAYLTVTSSYENATDSIRKMNEERQQKHDEAIKEAYAKYDARLVEKKEHLRKTEVSYKKQADLTTANRLEAEARALAVAKSYEDATDKLVDAANEIVDQEGKIENMSSAWRRTERPKRRPTPRVTELQPDRQRAMLPPVCS